ncbi:MAG: SMC-Scp complex subunit ScpB [Patescibacteria group bacterium]
MSLDANIEAILFAAGKPVALKRLAEWCEAEVEGVKSALDRLAERLEDSGLQLIRHGQEVELVTHPDAASLVRQVLKDETQGELTRPSLEALAILAYRGPLTRPELEQIRGVQCALILRNLIMRGLVETREDMRLGQPTYAVTVDFLKHLGLDGVESLPDFEELHSHRAVEQVLQEMQPKPMEQGSPSLGV